VPTIVVTDTGMVGTLPDAFASGGFAHPTRFVVPEKAGTHTPRIFN
jgi:hypothetical protein